MATHRAIAAEKIALAMDARFGVSFDLAETVAYQTLTDLSDNGIPSGMYIPYLVDVFHGRFNTPKRPTRQLLTEVRF